MRTLDGGFKLTEENQKKLYEILDIFHRSSDLMAFLSNHVHVDGNSRKPLDLLSLLNNNNGKTLETKSLDPNLMSLNPSNNLAYSYQVPNLIDQMLVLEELKNIEISPEILSKSFELRDNYGISLSMAQVMLTAVENKKGYLIPNLLRLNSEGKNYFETNYLEQRLLISLEEGDIELTRFLITNYPEDQLKTFLSQTNEYRENSLMLAELNMDQDTIALIINTAEKILDPNELKECFFQANEYGDNALTLAVRNGSKETAKLILNTITERLRPEELNTFLSQADEDVFNTLVALMVT